MEKEIIPETGNKEVSPLNALDRAEVIVKRIEEANIRSEQLLKANEEIATRMILGGNTNAGSKIPEPIQLSNREYAKKVMNGEFNAKK